MSDLIRRDDALAAVQEWTYCCDAETAIAALPAVTVGTDAVLDAAHKYLLEQYGASPLAHPIDRARILAALEPVAAHDPAAIREAALRLMQLYDSAMDDLLGEEIHRNHPDSDEMAEIRRVLGAPALIQKGTTDDRA